MKIPSLRFVLVLTSALFSGLSVAQNTASRNEPITPLAATAPTAVPALVPYSGAALNSDGQPLSGEMSITFLIYKDEAGGEPLFDETQTVALDSTGHYKAQLGAANPNGLPEDLFSSGEARWLEVQIAGQGTQPRVLLASVPYALKAADATTLGGLPASAYALAGQSTRVAVAAGVSPDATSNVTTPGGLSGYLSEFSGASSIVDSPVFVSGADVGIGTATPTATLTVAGTTVLNGAMTVNGSSTYNGGFTLPPPGTATSIKGYNSQFLKIETSAWNSSSASAVSPRFEWVGEVAGNNTATPTATLNLQSSTTTAPPTETGFHFNANGTMNFAPAQTFPTSTFTGAITDTSAVEAGSAIAATNTALLGTGVSGTGTGPGGYGVVGDADGDGNTGFTPVGVLGSSVPGYGVSAITESGIGLYSEAKTTGQAGYFTSAFGGPMNGEVTTPADTASVAIYNTNSATNANGYYNNTNPQGLYVEADGLNATGILGAVPNRGIGIWGTAGAGSNMAANLRAYVFNAGVWGDTIEGYDGSPQYYAVIGTTDDNTAGRFANNGPDYPTISVGNADAGGPTGLFKTIQASTPDGTCGFGGKGNLTCTGQVKTLATTSKSRMVETYAMQSPENWMEDFGSATLTNGVATVAIDPTFAETANTGAEYHVFLTPNGDSKGLYVTAKSATSFEVRESGGGTSSLAFDYRIVAKRLGHEGERLVDVTDRFHAETAETTKQMQAAANAHGTAAPRTASPASRKLPAPRIPQMQTPVQPTATTAPVKAAELQ